MADPNDARIAKALALEKQAEELLVQARALRQSWSDEMLERLRRSREQPAVLKAAEQASA